jgi:hypothetical protein
VPKNTLIILSLSHSLAAPPKLASTMSRIASRIGIARKAKEYVAKVKELNEPLPTYELHREIDRSYKLKGVAAVL